jgi:hypothetical protein
LRRNSFRQSLYGEIENLDLKNRRLSFSKRSVWNEKIVEKVLKKDVDAVFHLAALIDIPFSIKNPILVNHVLRRLFHFLPRSALPRMALRRKYGELG